MERESLFVVRGRYLGLQLSRVESRRSTRQTSLTNYTPSVHATLYYYRMSLALLLHLKPATNPKASTLAQTSSWIQFISRLLIQCPRKLGLYNPSFSHRGCKPLESPTTQRG